MLDKFREKIGKNVDFRVLTVSLDKNRVVLTAKKTLVKTDKSIIFDFKVKVCQSVRLPGWQSQMNAYLTQALAICLHQPGVEAHGVVLGVKPNIGVVVGFFNGIRGLVRKSDLGEEFAKDPEMSYRRGQV